MVFGILVHLYAYISSDLGLFRRVMHAYFLVLNFVLSLFFLVMYILTEALFYAILAILGHFLISWTRIIIPRDY